MKNLKAKTVKPEQAYEVYVGGRGTWTWQVLKHYASSEAEAKDPYARVFCNVISPIVGPQGELGDVYLSEIRGSASLVSKWCPTCKQQTVPLVMREGYACSGCANVLP